MCATRQNVHMIFVTLGNICLWLSNVHGKTWGSKCCCVCLTKKRGQAEKLEKKCPTNPFSTASQCWLKRRPSLRRRSCTTHHYHRPRSRVLLSHTKKYYHSTTPLCLFAIYHLILSSSFFCFPFWGYKAKRAAAQIVNSGWTKKSWFGPYRKGTAYGKKGGKP